MAAKGTYLSTESYKGVRDFYPEDMFLQKYIFETMRTAVERFGYVEYGASVIEPTELYKAKSGEEIVNEQTYSFKDRGERDVTLRPEMTPTVARMVAAKKRDLPFPLRWYSIPNLFRYEKPQKGRLREHFQLNVDLFGTASIQAEIEIILVADRIMKGFGAANADFEIRINSRKILNYLLQSVLALDDDAAYKLTKLIDRKDKMESNAFEIAVHELLGDRTTSFISLLSKKTIADFKAAAETEFKSDILGTEDITGLMEELTASGVHNAVFDPTLARGFDYYTGVVFEVFDTNPENRRALFGGGRYDDLLSIFGTDKVPAVGFGMGDVTIRDFLQTRNLLPTYRSSADIYLCRVGEVPFKRVHEIAAKLRSANVSVATDLTDRKVGDQIKAADKQSIPFVICIGEEELTSDTLKIKHLATRKEASLPLDKISVYIEAAKKPQ